MPACPFCQTEIPDDFGLIDCPNCKAALFVDMDGSVEASAPPAAEYESEPELPDEEFGATFAGQLIEESLQEESLPEESLPEEELEPTPQGPDEPLQVTEQRHDSAEATDISNMATAMDQQGVSEGLRYDLEISGIDTSDLRREVMESLMDKKLGWDVEDLMSQISAGTLKLQGVSAIKAHIVVQRLKTLPLDMRWDQYADT